MKIEIGVYNVDEVEDADGGDGELMGADIYINGWGQLSIAVGNKVYCISKGDIYELLINNFLSQEFGFETEVIRRQLRRLSEMEGRSG